MNPASAARSDASRAGGDGECAGGGRLQHAVVQDQQCSQNGNNGRDAGRNHGRSTPPGVSQSSPTNLIAPSPGAPPAPAGNDTPRSLSTGHTQLTQAGMVPGTPRYMAPEIFELKPADSRSNLFSFCVALYEALAQVHPFVDKSAARDMKRAPEPATGGSGAPAWVLRAVESGLERDPQRRPPSMDALLDTLAPPARPERGRWIAVALGVAVLLSAGAALTINWRTRLIERAQLCQGGPARLAGIWDESAKQRVHAAFVATGQPYAADVWSSVESSLDRYAREWTSMYHESCEATRLRGEQTDAVMTVRMACLDRKLQSMSALVEVLGQADTAMLEKAPSAATGLGSLAPCADVSGLLAAVPPPSDPAVRARLVDIHARLSRASALGLANRSAEASRVAALAVEEARATRERSILAEALATDGELRRTTEPAQAVPLLEEAFWQAFAARLDCVAVAAAIHLTHAHYLLSQPAEALVWQKHAQAGLERLDGDDELEAELWSVLGFGFDQRGKYDDALAAYRRAAVLCERRFGDDDLRTLRAQNEVLGALSNDNRVLEALPLAVSLLSRQEKLLGHGHPIVGRSLEELGAYEVLTGHLPEARAHMAEAEQLFRQAGAVGSRYWMALRSYQTWLAVHQGRMSDAESTAHEVLALLEKASMQQSEEALELEAHLARAEIGLGHADRAVVTLRKAIGSAEKTAGQETPMVASMLGALADAYAEQGKIAEATQAAEQNLAIAVRQAGTVSVEAAEARAALARVLVARPSEAARALALIDQSQPVLERVVGAQAPPVIAARRTRGQALLALGRANEAAVELRAALAGATRADLDPRLRQAIRQWLTRAETAQSSAANHHTP